MNIPVNTTNNIIYRIIFTTDQNSLLIIISLFSRIIEEKRLKIVYTSKGHREFESFPLHIDLGAIC